MEAEEPNLCVPLPSPQPTAKLLESLDLTPERKQTTRRFLKRRRRPVTGKLATTQLASQFNRPPLVLPSQLAAPTLNSTAQLYTKIQNLKRQRKAFSGQGDNVQQTQSQLSVPSEDSKLLNDLGDLQEVMRQKPLKEVNIPRHATRYSNLVSVDVSDESFQKMTVRPRKKEYLEPRRNGLQEEEPDIMDFFSPDLECEDALWTTGSSSCTTLAPTTVPNGAPFTLYRLMHFQ